MTHLGVDPGLHGAWALLDAKGSLIAADHFPLDAEGEVDAAALVETWRSFEGMPGGGIGAGVAKEVLEAWVLGKPVYRVVGGAMLWRLERNRDATMLMSEVLTIEETRARLRIISTMDIQAPASPPAPKPAKGGWLSGEDMIAAFYAK